MDPFQSAVETCRGARACTNGKTNQVLGGRAANVQPRQRLALLLVAGSASERVVESNSYRAFPLVAGRGNGFKSRQPDQLTLCVCNTFLRFQWPRANICKHAGRHADFFLISTTLGFGSRFIAVSHLATAVDSSPCNACAYTVAVT
jgi:hypothetical protein